MSITVRIELSDEDVAAIAPQVQAKAILGAVAWREAIRKEVALVVENWLAERRYFADERKQAVLAQLLEREEGR